MTTLVNWAEVKKDMDERPKVEFYKLQTGENKFKILSNGEIKEVKYQGDAVNKLFLDIEVSGTKKTWTITVPLNPSPRSQFGQLANLALNNGGSLEGLNINVIKVGSGKDTQYTIIKM